MTPFRPDIPPHVAEVSVIAAEPECSVPLLRELDGRWKFRVRRFRIVYVIDRKTRVIRLIAGGHRRHIYEELTARFRKK